MSSATSSFCASAGLCSGRVRTMSARRRPPAIGSPLLPQTYGRANLDYLLEKWVPVDFRARYESAVQSIIRISEPVVRGAPRCIESAWRLPSGQSAGERRRTVFLSRFRRHGRGPAGAGCLAAGARPRSRSSLAQRELLARRVSMRCAGSIDRDAPAASSLLRALALHSLYCLDREKVGRRSCLPPSFS